MLARHVTEVPTINKTHYYFFLLYCLCHQFLLRTACPPQSLSYSECPDSDLSVFSGAGLSLVSASSDQRATEMYRFCFQLSFSSQKYLKPSY